jgi:uncharacterized protein (TIGR00725 family)
MKYKICVSGSAVTGTCSPDAEEMTKELGREIVRQDGVLVTGATIGAPLWAAKGCKDAKGFSIGISPASSELEHVKKYKLPTEEFDIIIYTGFGYSGRNLLLIRSSDAVITVCGRIGTLNEFTIAFEDHKPIGILTGSGGIAEEINEIVQECGRPNPKIVYDDDPKKLVEKVLKLVEEDKKEIDLSRPIDYQEHKKPSQEK